MYFKFKARDNILDRLSIPKHIQDTVCCVNNREYLWPRAPSVKIRLKGDKVRIVNVEFDGTSNYAREGGLEFGCSSFLKLSVILTCEFTDYTCRIRWCSSLLHR